LAYKTTVFIMHVHKLLSWEIWGSHSGAAEY